LEFKRKGLEKKLKLAFPTLSSAKLCAFAENFNISFVVILLKRIKY
jgi:hypothetical protein